MAVKARDVAIPALLVVVVYVVAPLEKVALAPLDGAVNVTEAFATAFPPLSFTAATSKPPKLVPAAVLCPAPLEAEMLAAVPGITVNWKLFDVTVLKVAVMLACPTATAVTRPPAEMVATPVALDAHVTWPVRSAVVVSL